ncbi:DUF4910 domain-containing protein [Fervidicoccus fontis]|uniref:DUF4910 domain-containing protein n=1 Tax=Fervidicoccus fontis TaxID=683846 RepID=A0A7C2VMC4_9CREN|nr:DUF4910 domain-containing protein [Fervidicoccus fontis]MBE9391572.1 DUF4910 domain-containing protein [Fervidicoccus fontis]PMB78230.1 MAG: hypothetical protein C0177_00675 [Fervidicoccus fontis]HEW63494.1 DUF4910 domain-containing protein [Fervidicoccus fontis]
MKTIEEILDKIPINKLLSYTVELSQYNRVQGGRGIIDASKRVKEILEDFGLNPNLHLFQHDDSLMPFDANLVGWELEEGGLWIKKPIRALLSHTNKAITSVIVHSPPGEIAGELVYLPSGKCDKNCENKIVLTDDWSATNYFSFVDNGAIGVIAFRREGSETAYPYFSIFPSFEEISKAKAPAFTVTREDAMHLIYMINKGEKVEVEGYVKSRYNNVASIPVIEHSWGNGENEYHIISHLCHPGYTVNDNISGSIGNIAASIAMKYLDRSDLKDNIRINFVWVPEYSGSVSYLRKALSEGRKIIGTVNLDMIGEVQDITGSSLNFVRSPISLISPLEASTFKYMLDALPKSYGFSSITTFPTKKVWLINYEVGSDHDVYVSYGIPSVMLNMWPDKYYHSSEDTIDKFDIKQVASLGIASLLSILNVFNAPLKEYMNMVYGYDLMAIGDKELKKYRETLYCEAAQRLSVSPFYCEGVKHQANDKSFSIELKVNGFPSIRLLRKVLSKEELDEIMKMFETKRYMRTANSLVSVILSQRKKTSFSELKYILSGELGIKIEDIDLNTLLKAHEKVGTIYIKK